MKQDKPTKLFPVNAPMLLPIKKFKTVVISLDDDHITWLRKRHVNISSLVRELIADYIIKEKSKLKDPES